MRSVLERIAYTRAIQGLRPHDEYTLFLRRRRGSFRRAYTQAGRGNVYAIFEEEKGKFEKSVYERRTEIRHY